MDKTLVKTYVYKYTYLSYVPYRKIGLPLFRVDVVTPCSLEKVSRGEYHSEQTS